MSDIYLIYSGESTDGRGSPKLEGYTAIKSVAEAHEKNTKDNPYSLAKIVRVSCLDQPQEQGE